MWVYGSGFPKSLDVSKAIDKAAGVEREVIEAGRAVKRMIPGADQDKTGSWIKDNGREFVPTVTAPATDAARKWQGWGTALKPAHEPICVARKPFKGTVADNVLRYGTGAMNIDGCRAGIEERTYKGSGAQPHKLNAHEKGDTGIGYMDGSGKDKEFTVNGRWPANFIHDGSEEVVGLFPVSKGHQGDVRGTEKSHTGDANTNCYGEYGRVPAPKRIETPGSAARFFYCAKASRSERGEGNNHPTVKPLALMRYLCRLVTPPEGLILDPFCGSGSTILAALDEGFRCTGVDLDAAISKRRVENYKPDIKDAQMDLGLMEADCGW
jgi:site-specific DNA-methyltransferase (adenine-specific)